MSQSSGTVIPSQGQPAPGAVFKPDPGGNHVVVLPRNLHGLTALAVTAEVGPNGTSAPVGATTADRQDRVIWLPPEFVQDPGDPGRSLPE